MTSVRSADGTTIDYEITGSGPTVVLICAGPTDRNSNAELAGLLAGSCTVVNYDRRGRGASGDTPPYAVEREIDDLRAVVEGPGRRPRRPVRQLRRRVPGLPSCRPTGWPANGSRSGSRRMSCPTPGPRCRPTTPTSRRKLAEKGDTGAMAELFLVTAVGMPADGRRDAPGPLLGVPGGGGRARAGLRRPARRRLRHRHPATVAHQVPGPGGGRRHHPVAHPSRRRGCRRDPHRGPADAAGQHHNVQASAPAPALARFFTS